MVKEQVALNLLEHVPESLQADLAMRKRQLEEVQQALHNSESRRANAELRSGNTDGTLHTIYRSDGEISPLFPEDLSSLFALDGDTAKRLLMEYEQGPITSDSRESNLNRFIQFCGVLYQVVTRVEQTSPIEDDVAYRSPVVVKHMKGFFGQK